jgi:hypothetical protein
LEREQNDFKELTTNTACSRWFTQHHFLSKEVLGMLPKLERRELISSFNRLSWRPYLGI